MNLENELNLAINVATRVGSYLKNISKIEVLSSEGKDIKLNADIESEKIIIRELSRTPYQIISEEKQDNPKRGKEPIWIVDPLDGSLNFSRGIPNSAVSISLWQESHPLVGVVYDFNRDDLYFGSFENGASLNDKEIFVSGVSDKKNSVLCTGFPVRADFSSRTLVDLVKQIQEFKKIRLLGSAALSLAYVASGKAEAYQEKGIMLWDVAAGLALVKFAGGSFNLMDLGEYKCNVWASNGRIENKI